jgi:hypothetical protein
LETTEFLSFQSKGEIKMNQKILVVCSFVLGGLVAPAYALDITPEVAIAFSNYSLTPPNAGSGMGGGGGVGALIGFGDVYGFETGLVLMFRSFSLGSNVTVLNGTVEVPFLFRLQPDIFIFEAGGYFGLPIGETAMSGGITQNLQNPNTDVGLRAVAGVGVPLGKKVKFRGALQFSYGLTNLSTGTSTEYSRLFDILLGITIMT